MIARIVIASLASCCFFSESGALAHSQFAAQAGSSLIAFVSDRDGSNLYLQNAGRQWFRVRFAEPCRALRYKQHQIAFLTDGGQGEPSSGAFVLVGANRCSIATTVPSDPPTVTKWGFVASAAEEAEGLGALNASLRQYQNQYQKTGPYDPFQSLRDPTPAIRH